ncbi:MAG: 3-hydroxybutyryl-CoA dehydrogenase [Candidatus Rokubacteria bacterium]|nr:3-hydroxybutyryl-CoA dehydrogenase [Candidatus Rokubacteria bacterium]
MEKVAVIGAGVMGTGIAQVFAQFGLAVAQTDVSEALLARSKERMLANLEGLVVKGKLAKSEVDAVLARIVQTVVVEAAAKEADFVVEAVVEDLETKKKVFGEWDPICPPRTILATNTSVLSPTEVASVTRRPEKCIGMHFMNPAPLMKLVEVVPGLLTAPETIEMTKALARRIGKTPVVARESPGGIVSRIMVAMRNEAVDILAEGIATAEDIDTAMKLGAGFPLGPLELIDLVGVDLHVTNSETMMRETGNAKYRPHPLLRKMVRAGHHGRKSGRGFYTYER